MDHSMINKIEKAKRYAEEPERITFNSLEIEFQGDNSAYTITLGPDGWGCTCPGFGNYAICPHIMAIEKTLSPMLKRDPLPYAAGQNIVSDVRKAKRYSEESDRMKILYFDATFRGTHNEHHITYNRGKWDSSSAYFKSRGISSQTMAMERILGDLVAPINMAAQAGV